MYLSERPRQVSAHTHQARRAGGRVPRTVLLLGTVSLLTDISSESTASVLPLYLTLGLGLSPMAYGFVDGVYQGTSVLVRVVGGWWADRFDRPKPVAVVGYGISAIARMVFLTSGGLVGVTTWLGVDRVGKGLRTAPRDSLIAAASDAGSLGASFGVHRSLDTTGAVLGPILAFAVLGAFPGRLLNGLRGLRGCGTTGVGGAGAARPRSASDAGDPGRRGRQARSTLVEGSRRTADGTIPGGRGSARAAHDRRRFRVPRAAASCRPRGALLPPSLCRDGRRLPGAGHPLRTTGRPSSDVPR